MIFLQTIQLFCSTFQLILANLFRFQSLSNFTIKLTGILLTLLFCKQLHFFQDQIFVLINSDNIDPINIINNTSNILTDTIMNTHNHLPKKLSNHTTAFQVPFNFRWNKKSKRAFINSRNQFLKSALNAISKKL